MTGEDVRLFERAAAGLTMKRSITGARFVRLYGQHGYPLADTPPEP